jgi:glycosyltransferase involved in cell wall biosynthesis
VGGYGWKSEGLINRITKHPRYGRNLYLIRDASDRDLNRLYNICSALIIASLAEGFGLPIVEAFNHGASVLCSDIPVFREVAGERAEFFDLTDPTVLSKLVIKHAELFQNSNHSRYNGGVAWLTWHQSAEQLFLRLVALAR